MTAKRFSSLLLLFALLFAAVVLSGCHGAKTLDSFSIPESFDMDREYEITFWAKNDTNKTQTDIYRSAIAGFEKMYPNIHVTLRLYTDYSKIYNDVITNIPTQTTPNVCITYPDHIATYKTGVNVVVPLNDLFADPAYGFGGTEIRFDAPKQDEIIAKFLNECRFADGSYYAVPFMRSTEACYINKDFVERLGYEVPDILTWDFIWEVSEAALKKNSDGTYFVNGGNIMIPFIYKSTDNMMIQMTQQLQSGYSDADGNIYLFNDKTKDLLYSIADHAESKAFSTFKISSYPANFLNAGQCIFAIDSTAGSTWMGTNAPLLDIPKDSLVEFETVVRPIPQYDSDNLQMISQGPSICVFNKSDSQEVLASWIFTQYLLTNDVQNAYAETEGYIPVTAKAQQSQDYQAYLSQSGQDNQLHYAVKIDATNLLLSHIDDTFVTPVFNGSASLRTAAGDLIENVVIAKNRSQTVDDSFMTSLYEKMVSLHHLKVKAIPSDESDSYERSDVSTDPTSGKANFGPLPSTAVALLIALGVVWILIIAYFIWTKIRAKKAK